MRVYLASYATLYTVMSEIPVDGRTAYDNLVYPHFSLRYRDDVVFEGSRIHGDLYRPKPTGVRCERSHPEHKPDAERGNLQCHRNGVGLLRWRQFDAGHFHGKQQRKRLVIHQPPA